MQQAATPVQVKQKVSRMEFRFRAKSGNKTFDEPSYIYIYMI